MKVILSRKGFDSSNGGCPSPILPDGTLLSLPIPSADRDTYDDLSYQGVSYADLLRQLRPGKEFSHCHVDPDLRPNLRCAPIPGWKPAFGQVDAAQGLLTNAGVEIGDLNVQERNGLFSQTVWLERSVKTKSMALHSGSGRFHGQTLQKTALCVLTQKAVRTLPILLEFLPDSLFVAVNLPAADALQSQSA